jgi:hypothetical protein
MNPHCTVIPRAAVSSLRGSAKVVLLRGGSAVPQRYQQQVPRSAKTNLICLICFPERGMTVLSV